MTPRRVPLERTYDGFPDLEAHILRQVDAAGMDGISSSDIQDTLRPAYGRVMELLVLEEILGRLEREWRIVRSDIGGRCYSSELYDAYELSVKAGYLEWLIRYLNRCERVAPGHVDYRWIQVMLPDLRDRIAYRRAELLELAAYRDPDVATVFPDQTVSGHIKHKREHRS